MCRVFLLVLLLCCCGVLAAKELDFTLVQVQVVHRHGSRSALVDYNETAICGYEYPCGFLNEQGQRMLVNIGSFLRERYTSDETVVNRKSPFLTRESYNLSVSYSRSTDVLRTLQSADGLQRGLFPNLSAYYPAIHTVYNPTDDLLNSGSIPVLRAKYHYALPEEKAACESLVDRHFTPTSLTEVAAEVHYDGYCSNWDNRMECAKTLCDIAWAYEATGQLSEHPKLKKNIDKICAVLICSSKFLFSYNSTDPVQRNQGSTGQKLAQTLISNMRDTFTGRNTFKLMEYSAHDTTLAPLAATLGDNSDKAMMPPFATTYVMELLRRKEATVHSTAESDYSVRVLRGHPGSTPESNYVFSWDGFQLQCKSESGSIYVATDNTCSFADFVRFIDHSKPQHKSGLCYIDPVLFTRMNCSSTTTAFELTSDCLKYRQQCPSDACGGSGFVSLADMNCYSSGSEGGNNSNSNGNASSSGTSTGIVVLIAFIMLAVGAALCYGVQFAYRKYKGYHQVDGDAYIEMV